jgi:hypothetical protein
MASKKPSKPAIHYVQRLFEDEYVQGQLRDAAGGIRSAYDRISKKPARAAEDKRLYGHVRQAAISIRRALLALRRPEPEPEPKHRFRTAVVAVAVVGASILIISKRESTSHPADASKGDAADAFGGDRASELTAEPETASSPTTD